MKTSTLAGILSLLALTVSVQAQVVGSWQGSTGDGWIDWSQSTPVGSYGGVDVLSSPNFSLQSGVAAGYSQSLQFENTGFQQTLAIKLEYSGENSAFLTNHLFSITWSIPSAATAGVTSGYNQIYALAVNASGYGFNNLTTANSTITQTGSGSLTGNGGELDYYSGSAMQSQTLTWDYSSILPSITATGSSGYIELVFSLNTGGTGNPGIIDFNNAVFSGGVVPAPEPSTLALLGMGVVGLGTMIRRKK